MSLITDIGEAEKSRSRILKNRHSFIIHCLTSDATGFPKLYFTKIIYTQYGHKKDSVIKYANIIRITDSTIHIIFIHTLKALRNPPVNLNQLFPNLLSSLHFFHRTPISITQHMTGICCAGKYG